MTERTAEDLQANLLRLEQLYQQGLLTEELYRAALTGLGMDAAAVFAQSKQRVAQQINVAGNFYDQRPLVLEPGAGPEAFRRAYLHRVAQQTRRLPLTGVDPKAVGDESRAELQLSAVYTALLTQRPEMDKAMHGARALEPMAHDVRRLSALDVLNREQRLALLGDPGSGKSTFVNFVALCMAGETLSLAEANLKTLTAPLPDEAEASGSGGKEKARPQP